MDEWTMRNGETIKIKNMTTQHIENTIKAIHEGRALIPKRSPIDLDEAEMLSEIVIDYLYSFNDELERREKVIK